MKVILLSLICLTKCCSLSSPEACALKRLSYGGRMLQIDDGEIGVLPNSWANRRVFVFRIPPSLLKKRHRGSVFGQKGIARIWIANENFACADRIQEQCPWIANQNSGSCSVDPTVPCYKTPPSYSQIAPISFLDITPTSITVKWPAWNATVDLGHGPVVGYIINIRKLGEEAFMQVPTSFQLSHEFIDLEENTEYEFQLIVVRDHPFGEGPPSNIQTHMTSVREPPSYSNHEPLLFSDITSSAATVSWPAWNESVDRGTGPVTGYRLLYRVANESHWETRDTDELSTRLIHLQDHTSYEVSILLQYGDRIYTEKKGSQSFTTCKVLDNIHLQVSSISDEPGYASISVEWSYSESVDSCLNIEEQNIIINQLDWDRCQISHREPFQEVLDTVTRTYTQSHRRANSLYNVTIIAKTPTGISSQWKVLRTDTSRPTAEPYNLRRSFKNRHQNLSILRWNYPICGQRNGNITAFEYVFQRFSQPQERGRTTAKRIVLTSLELDKTYSFQISAVTEKGAGPNATFEEVF